VEVYPFYIQEDHVRFRMVFGMDWRFGAPPCFSYDDALGRHRCIRIIFFLFSFENSTYHAWALLHLRCILLLSVSFFVFISFTNIYYYSVALRLLTGVAVFDVSFFFPG
jgi:hypothetical protein